MPWLEEIDPPTLTTSNAALPLACSDVLVDVSDERAL